MSRMRFVLLSLVVASSVGAVAASPASAAINFEWRVNGSKLEPGHTAPFSFNTDGKTLALRGSVDGVAVLLLSNKISVESGAKIIGGIPGTDEETIVFENVKVDNPANCDVADESITTNALRSEIVEAAPGAAGDNEPVLLFEPAEGGTFAEFEFLGATCPVNDVTAAITGDVLGLPSPPKTEVVRGDLIFEAITKEYKVSAGGAAKKAGLVFAGNPMTLTGLTLMVLNSSQAFKAQ